MAETWYPKAKRLPITTGEYNKNRGMPILAICNHITAGGDSRDWLQHANNSSSVHFLIRVEGGKAVVYQFMPIEWMAWANGRHSGVGNPFMPEWVRDYIRQGINPNSFTISIEHEGVTPSAALYTGPMLETTIELHKWIAATVPTVKVEHGRLLGHFMIDNVQRPFCPGGPGGKLFPFDRIISALKGAPTPTPMPTPLPPVPQPPPVPPVAAIEVYATAHPYVGLPLEAHEVMRVLEDGREYSTRLYERALLHWRAGEPVGEARIGVMWQEAVEAAA